MMDEPPTEKHGFGFDRATALYWSLLFCALIVALFGFDTYYEQAWGPICVGDPGEDCYYSPVAIDQAFFDIWLAFAVSSAAWLARKRERDAHPWLVNLTGWLGVLFAALLFGTFHSALTSVIPFISNAGVALTAVTVCTIPAVIAATLFRIRRPKTWWTRALTVALPLVAVGYPMWNYRPPQELGQRRVEHASYYLDRAANHAADQVEQFPENQKKVRATGWLAQPRWTGGDALEQLVGEVDDVGRGQGFVSLAHYVWSEASRAQKPALAQAAQMANQGLLHNLYVVGRRESGHCLVERRATVDPERPFAIVGSGATPLIVWKTRPVYCLVGRSLYAFDDDQAPTKAATLECLPKSAPSPHAENPTEQLISRSLRAVATGESSDLLADTCPQALERWHEHQAHTLATHPKFPERLRADPWGAHADDALDLLPPEPSTVDYEEIPLGRRLQFLRHTIERSQRAGLPLKPEQLRPVFGRILDTFSSHKLDNAVEQFFVDSLELGGRSTEARQELRDKLASGIDVARYVVGQERTGWCLYRLRAKTAPAVGETGMRAQVDHQLRYCMADHELVSFDADGHLEHTWDASGFVRHALVSDPTDPSTLRGMTHEEREKLGDRLAHDRLLETFVDALVSGELTQVSQLDTMSLARGADLLEPSVQQAMRRMVRQSPHPTK